MNLEQIDTSTTAGKAEVMRLAAEGRRVAQQFLGEPSFKAVEKPAWDWVLLDYAIIAEPVGPDEVFVAIAPGPVLEGAAWNACDAAGLLPGRRGDVVKYIRADLAGEVK